MSLQESIWQRQMDWLLTNCDSLLLNIWCTLHGEGAKYLLNLSGAGGIGMIIGSLWTLQKPKSDIVTIQNKSLRKRRRTIFLGWIAILAICTAGGLQVWCSNMLHPLGKDCEIAN